MEVFRFIYSIFCLREGFVFYVRISFWMFFFCMMMMGINFIVLFVVLERCCLFVEILIVFDVIVLSVWIVWLVLGFWGRCML